MTAWTKLLYKFKYRLIQASVRFIIFKSMYADIVRQADILNCFEGKREAGR